MDSEIGRGAHGTTWGGYDERDAAAVAIKELPLRLGTPEKVVALFRREADVLASLQHPDIPRCREVLETGAGRTRTLWLVLDRVEGEDLEREMRRHRYDEREVLDIMLRVLRVLEYLHGRSPPVVHRDLKPANLIRRPDGGLSVVDFGSVRDALRSDGLGSTVAGTFGFMAPEQYAGDAEPRTDLYGLGATAVALLTRKAPHLLQDPGGVIQWRSSANLSERGARILDRLLAPDPVDRFGSAAEAIAAIEGAEIQPSPSLPAVVAPAPLRLPERSISARAITLTGSGREPVKAAHHASLLVTAEHLLGQGLQFEPIGDGVRLSPPALRGRELRITVEPAGSGTRILAREDLTGLMFGLYGSMLGGIGGGVGGGVGWLFFAHAGLLGGFVFLGGLLLAAALLATGVYREVVRSRVKEVQRTIEALEQHLGGPAVEHGRPDLPEAGTSAFAAAAGVALGTAAILLATSGPALGISVPWGYLGFFTFIGVFAIGRKRKKKTGPR